MSSAEDIPLRGKVLVKHYSGVCPWCNGTLEFTITVNGKSRVMGNIKRCCGNWHREKNGQRLQARPTPTKEQN